MKILTVQKSSPICFNGLIKGSKTVPVHIMKSPTKEMLKEAEIKLQKQIEDLGLVVIKEIKMCMQTNPETSFKVDTYSKTSKYL